MSDDVMGAALRKRRGDHVTVRPKEIATSFIKTLLTEIPVVGVAARIKFNLDGDIEMRRMGEIVNDLVETQDSQGATLESLSGDMKRLAAHVLMDAAEETQSLKRELLSQLLRNAARIPEDGREWESAKLAASLIKSLDAPALEIIAEVCRVAGVHDRQNRSDAIIFAVLRWPKPSVRVGNFGAQERAKLEDTQPTEGLLSYEWAVVSHAMVTMIARGVVTIPGAIPWNPERGTKQLELTSLGLLLARWALSPDAETQPAAE